MNIINDIAKTQASTWDNISTKIDENFTEVVNSYRKNMSIVSDANATSLAVAENTYYSFGELSTLTITSVFTNPSVESIINFSSGSVATTVSFPSTVKIIGNATIEANKSYVISFMGNIVVIGGYE